MAAPLKIGLIGGTGLGDALGAQGGERREMHTPFGSPSAPILLSNLSGVDVAIVQRHGIGHPFNPTSVPYRANIYALKSLGVTHVVAFGATGSLREHLRPRDLVLVDQFIDKTTRRVSTFFEKAAVHCEFANPTCPIMTQWLHHASTQLPDMTVHNGATYICMEGPAFSTRAESHMHRTWGGDLIGMTAMPEAKLCREAEMAYALVALPTDYDCWRPHDAETDPQHLLQEIIGNVKTATANAIALLKKALTDTTLLTQQPSVAHNALALAIWSDKTRIPIEEIEKLNALWGKYF